MDSLCKIVDRCLKLMKPYQMFPLEKWWEEIIRDGEVPPHKSYKYQKWISKRCRLKNSVNKELERRKRPERLMFIGHGEGIRLVDENEVGEITVDRRVRKIISIFERGQKEMVRLAICDKMSTEDRTMLTDMARMIELQQNTIIGTMAKMPSLPEPTKKRILKHLGIKLPAKKRNKKSKQNKPIRKWNVKTKKPFEKPAKLFRANQILKTQADAARYAAVSKRTIRRWLHENNMLVTTEGYYIKAVLDRTQYP